ncbi:phage major tail tube protein [Chitinimonas arctica]|uniref:Phage major tail tube protein n=1 Tax=Chitinimonas arctica TaxID=2594795 RepID=A0A516SAU3_9NEIS|nr:phage major tail tube protein [Chitinimonas arctica]QDQ25274.1 phage major tail tube protein [Chitinimonas arctica]
MVPQALYNMNAFIDGKGYAGLAMSVTPPKLKLKTDDHRPGGSDAAIKIDMGMETLEGSFTLSGLDAGALKFFGLADQTAFNGSFRGAFKDQKGAVVAAIISMRGMLEELDMGDWKPGEKSENKFGIALSYYKLELDGKVMYEIEPLACRRVIDGVDQLDKVREALGM